MANDVFEVRWDLAAKAGARAQLCLHFESDQAGNDPFRHASYVAAIVHNNLREFLGEALPRLWLMLHVRVRRINNGGGPTFTLQEYFPSDLFNDGFTRFCLSALVKISFRCAGKWLTTRLWIPGVQDTATEANHFKDEQLFRLRLFVNQLNGVYTFGDITAHFVCWSETYRVAVDPVGYYVHVNPRPLASRGRTNLQR